MSTKISELIATGKDRRETPNEIRKYLGDNFDIPRMENEGKLFRTSPCKNHVRSGDEAGWSDKRKCRRIQVGKYVYLTHRLVWLWFYGVFPSKCIDHIDQDPSNNIITNLRDATLKENAANQSLNPDSKSGHLGVRFHEFSGLWCVLINNRQGGNYSKYFKSKDEAVSHAKEKYKEFGYHPNHGSKRKDHVKY